MTLIDVSALRAAFRFVVDNPALIAVGAALYGAVFAVQSLLTAYAGAYAPGAAPGALGFALVAFGVFIVVIAGFGRTMLDRPAQGLAGFTLGGDEGRLAWVVVLVLILVLTVLGTALVALSFMLAALALINVDANAEPPEGFVNIFAMFGPGEMAVAALLIGVFIAFSAWLFTRLTLAVPATLQAQAVKVLSIWPSSSKKGFEIALTLLVALLPGVVILTGFNALCMLFLGAGPAVAQSASGEAGALTHNPAVLVVIYALYGGLKIAVLAAPGLRVLTSLYLKFSSQTMVDAG